MARLLERNPAVLHPLGESRRSRATLLDEGSILIQSWIKAYRFSGVPLN